MIRANPSHTVFHSTLLEKFHVVHGFGTKQLGDGRDIGVLEQYLQSLHIHYSQIVQPHQTHSTNTHIITSRSTEPIITIPDCDGIITQQKDVVLTVVTADCVPIILFDPITQTIGISHQGWKGTTNQLPKYMIERMISLGAQPSHIRCILGPAINICCYHMNLIQINMETVLKEGVLKAHTDVFPFCTACDEKRFYSYRREGRINGEMIHFVMLSQN